MFGVLVFHRPAEMMAEQTSNHAGPSLDVRIIRSNGRNYRHSCLTQFNSKRVLQRQFQSQKYYRPRFYSYSICTRV